MAWAVNGALGTKMAFPDRPVIVGCGDGCYLLSGFELMTAVRYNLPVIWIIFHDGEYKLIKLYQIEAFHETGLVDFDNPDYVAYAKACGAQGFRVDSLSEFEAAFRAALASGKPTLIDASITRLAIPNTARTPPEFWRRSKKASRRSWTEVEAPDRCPPRPLHAPERQRETRPVSLRVRAEGVAMSDNCAGFDEMSKYPLFEALHKRRSRRIGLGLKSVPAGSNTYTSNAEPQPLSELAIKQ